MMFELQTFPARDGDALILAWGDDLAPRRLMIDGGREGCWPEMKAAILDLPEAERTFELLVVTHIDADHIAGVLKMLEDPDRPVRFKEIWFNGYHHLRRPEPHETFGTDQGDQLSTQLLKAPQLWNRSFDHGPVVVVDVGSPPRVTLDGGLELTLLSPTPKKLERLEREWRAWIEEERLKPDAQIAPEPPPPTEYPAGWDTFGSIPDVAALAAMPLPRDSEPPNGSSIAFAARFDEHALLLTGDAHPEILAAALKALPEHERRFALVKLSHHGSCKNLGAETAQTWRSRNFLISTNGTRHHHPDAQTIAHLIAARPGPKTFYFNHSHQEAAVWGLADLKREYKYDAVYPEMPGRLTFDLTTLPHPE